ncbi:AAA family ATPase [Planctomycetota bacterium]
MSNEKKCTTKKKIKSKKKATPAEAAMDNDAQDQAYDTQTAESSMAEEMHEFMDEFGSIVYIPDTTNMGTVEPKDVEWLWRPYIPLGEMTSMIGDGDAGKSTLIAYIASRVTTGRRFHLCDDEVSVGSVIWIVQEEDKEKGLARKLEANCADVDKVEHFVTVSKKGESKIFFDVTRHIDALRLQCKLMGDVKLIIIDPITAFIGDTNANCNSAVRQMLLKLNDVAREFNCAVININHVNKDEEKSLINRGLGSQAFKTAVRSQVVVHRGTDPETGHKLNRRYFGVHKGNYIEEDCPKVLVFKIEKWACWFEPEPANKSLDYVVKGEGPKGRPKKKKSKEYEDWLVGKLKKGVRAEEAIEVAKALNINRGHAYEIAKKVGFDTNGRKNNGMWLKSEK